MAEIQKTGIIPASNNVVYKENLRISDTVVGKYISLDGFKKFHNPGVGLDLSAPTTDVVIVSNEFRSNNLSSSETASVSSYSAMAYLIFPTNTVIVDNLSGVGKKNIGVGMQGVSAGQAVDNFPAFNSIPASAQIIKANITGTYVISFTTNGNVSNSVSNGAFTSWMQFYVRIKGVETPLTAVASFISPGGSSRPQYNSNSFTVNYSGTVNLSIGDSVEIYGKCGSDGWKGANHSTTLNTSNTVLSVKMDTTQGPTQTFFSNPQNIPQMNIKSINYYGNSRDTLKLIGNNLTS